MNHKFVIASAILILGTVAKPAISMTSIMCPGADCAIEVNGNVINWPDSRSYYQVQEVVVNQGRTTYESRCDGETFCIVDPGTYQVTDLSNMKRYVGVVVNDIPASSSTPNSRSEGNARVIDTLKLFPLDSMNRFHDFAKLFHTGMIFDTYKHNLIDDSKKENGNTIFTYDCPQGGRISVRASTGRMGSYLYDANDCGAFRIVVNGKYYASSFANESRYALADFGRQARVMFSIREFRGEIINLTNRKVVSITRKASDKPSGLYILRPFDKSVDGSLKSYKLRNDATLKLLPGSGREVETNRLSYIQKYSKTNDEAGNSYSIKYNMRMIKTHNTDYRDVKEINLEGSFYFPYPNSDAVVSSMQVDLQWGQNGRLTSAQSNNDLSAAYLINNSTRGRLYWSGIPLINNDLLPFHLNQ